MKMTAEEERELYLDIKKRITARVNEKAAAHAAAVQGLQDQKLEDLTAEMHGISPRDPRFKTLVEAHKIKLDRSAPLEGRIVSVSEAVAWKNEVEAKTAALAGMDIRTQRAEMKVASAELDRLMREKPDHVLADVAPKEE